MKKTIKPRSYFWRELGLNADIDRHRNEESKLRAKIAELEAKKSLDYFDQAGLRTYKHLLNQLLQSKAEVVNKIRKSK
jgi:hypothetical protein